MKYLMLLHADSPMPEPGTPEARKLFDDWAEARQAMTDAGVLIECAPLPPAVASTTVRVQGGETLFRDCWWPAEDAVQDACVRARPAAPRSPADAAGGRGGA
jgi:hypothetical protein